MASKGKGGATAKNKTGQMTDAEKELIRMKDEDGASWFAMKNFWEKENNVTILVESIKKRYSRLKEKHQGWKEGDETKLMEAKKTVEDNWETKKWQAISEEFVNLGGERKTVEALKKKAAEIVRAGASAGASAVAAGASGPSISKRAASPKDGPSAKTRKTTTATKTGAQGKGKGGKTKVKAEDEDDEDEETTGGEDVDEEEEGDNGEEEEEEEGI